MDKLAEEIWKTILCSLIVTTAIVGFLRYLDQDNWWRIPQKPPYLEKFDNNPLVYYSVENISRKGSPTAGLFFMNTLQKIVDGEHGVFEDVLAGQVLSVKVSAFGHTVRSPSFRLQDREIRHLVFTLKDDKLEFSGSHSRFRNPVMPKALGRDSDQLAIAGVLKLIGSYQPIEKVEAKEKEKKKLRDNDVNDLPGNVNPFENRLPFYMFLHSR